MASTAVELSAVVRATLGVSRLLLLGVGPTATAAAPATTSSTRAAGSGLPPAGSGVPARWCWCGGAEVRCAARCPWALFPSLEAPLEVAPLLWS